jgi:DNA-directed RNA polymerase subunit alpha
MAILAFQKPDKVLMLEADPKFGKFEFRPLEPGFGITIGNALRRILLSSLEGFAITTIKIDGVEHEFANIPGVREDVTNIILNLKKVRFKQNVEEFESEKVSITIESSKEFKAGDIGKYLTGFEVLNPELVICHLDPKATMKIELTINKGRGYVPADENRDYITDVNVIPIDSIYTPIRNVKYWAENFRVEQKTDYEKLVLEITTDGSIHPKDALKEAAKILIYHFMLFSDEKIILETVDEEENEEFDEEVLHMRQLLKTKLVDMDLSVRALNCLKTAEVETLGDLVQFNKTDLLKFRNFGKKSLTELDELLESLNLSFGTDISKYKLEKETKPHET